MPGTVYKGDLAEVSFATETGFTLVHGTDADFSASAGATSFTFTSGATPFFASNNLEFPKDMLVGSQFVLTSAGTGDNAADGRVFTITGNEGATLNFSPALLAATGTGHSLHVLPYKTPPVDAANNTYAGASPTAPTESVLTDQFLGIATALTLPETKVDLKRYHVVGLGRDTAVQVPGKFITEGGSFEVAMHTARWLKYCLGNEITVPTDIVLGGVVNTTGVFVNNGAGYSSGETGPITVDGEDATTKFSIGYSVQKTDGTNVGVVTAVTTTTITMSAGTLVSLVDDDELYAFAPTQKTTLNANTKAGACFITVTNATDFAAGKYVGIQPASGTVPVVLDHEATDTWTNVVTDRDFDQATPYEVRRIVAVSSTKIFLDEPLIYDHANSDKVFLYDYQAGEAPTIDTSTCAITKPVTHLLFARSHVPSFSLEVSHRRLDKDADGVIDGSATDAKTLTRMFRGCKVTDFTLSTDNDAALRLAVNFNSALCYTDAGRLETPGTTSDRYNPHRLFDDTANTHANRLKSGIGLGTQKPFMFYDGSINIAGVQAGKVLNFTLSGQTGMQAFHTINGSTQNSGTADEAVPFGGSRNTALMVEGKTSYELSLEVMVDDPLFFNKMRSATEFSVHKDGDANGQIVIEFEKPLGNTLAANSERMVILIDEYYIVEAPLQIPEDKGVVKSQLKVMPKSMRVLSRDTLLKY
jgi:hypothetical protein